jgi:hypothetical protein
MKKVLAVCLKKLLPLMCMVGMVTGCAAMIGAMLEPVVTAPFELAADIITDAAEDSASDARESGKRKSKFAKEYRVNPLDSPVEDRLTRRASTLDGGIPVDVSPYLLHDYSFVVTEEGTRSGTSVLRGTKDRGFLSEYDTVLTFKADKQDYEMNVTTAVCDGKGYIADRTKRYLKQFAAGLFGLEPNKIQSFKVQSWWRKHGAIDLWDSKIDNVFVQITEPCYFQFDVEVEYQKMKMKEGVEPSAQFDVFNKVYRSDFTIPAAAALDVQAQIWQDVCALSEVTFDLIGFFRTNPLPPIINVVRAAKFTQ